MKIFKVIGILLFFQNEFTEQTFEHSKYNSDQP